MPSGQCGGGARWHIVFMAVYAEAVNGFSWLDECDILKLFVHTD